MLDKTLSELAPYWEHASVTHHSGRQIRETRIGYLEPVQVCEPSAEVTITVTFNTTPERGRKLADQMAALRKKALAWEAG